MLSVSCGGQGNTIVSHFVVQRADFIVAIACVPCGPRRSLIFACEWGFWVCWEIVCCWANKTWLLPYACCGLHFYWLCCLCPVILCFTPLHYICIEEKYFTHRYTHAQAHIYAGRLTNIYLCTHTSWQDMHVHTDRHRCIWTHTQAHIPTSPLPPQLLSVM